MSPATVTAASATAGTSSSSVRPSSPWIERGGQLLRGEAERLQVGAHERQLLEFEVQHLEVPAGVQRDAVVGEHQLAALRLGQPAQQRSPAPRPDQAAARRRAARDPR